MLKDLVTKCRTYRRFYQEVSISAEELQEFIDLARLTASTANSQALKFHISNTPEENTLIFNTLGWAGALPDWDGPEEGERPSAYIVILCDLSLGKNKLTDDGIAAQTIMLGAVEKGYGGCMLGNVRRSQLAESLGIDPSLYSIDLARLTASTANSQALKFHISNTPEENALIFNTLGWAGALPDWDGPEEGERPSAYIVILCDLSLGKNKLTDDGIAAQTIMLGALEKGYGGCMLGNVRRSQLAESLGIDPALYSIDLVLALGKPKEEVVIVPMKEDGNVRYYRDENQIHYVPKRELKDIII